MVTAFLSTTEPAAVPPNTSLVLGGVLCGVAVAWLAYQIFALIYRPYRMAAESWEFEENRRIQLRTASRTYRWLEPLVEEIKGSSLLGWLGGTARVENALRLRGTTVPWTAEEYLAVRALESVGVGVGAWFLVSNFAGMFVTGFIAVFAAFCYLRIGVQKLSGTATMRMARFKQRLPFSVDLLALMMQAGGGFRESLRTVVNESDGHPVGEEFAGVLRSLARGQSMRASLEEFQNRLGDGDVDELVFAVVKAEELGTPLSKIFLTMADQIRLKRSQWAEVAAGKAQTMITFPGLVVMLACLLIVVAPFVIDAIENSPF
ncbi:Bacterial type II secretion system protein F domain protein [Symmachiella dynata]|uniref:Bacterial type II secretion system protein F domain protein n=1 Tax=Symmachiella dynata TaxID=2527995 RepID=A0A517ZQU6_9PLAN|nr:type II secretion system F family protein [Symmachiella dynata]QDU44869.1 Bacterial type II secretion system protein F domain protein [Symmachiella dynata]